MLLRRNSFLRVWGLSGATENTENISPFSLWSPDPQHQQMCKNTENHTSTRRNEGASIDWTSNLKPGLYAPLCKRRDALPQADECPRWHTAYDTINHRRGFTDHPGARDGVSHLSPVTAQFEPTCRCQGAEELSVQHRGASARTSTRSFAHGAAEPNRRLCSSAPLSSAACRSGCGCFPPFYLHLLLHLPFNLLPHP